MDQKFVEGMDFGLQWLMVMVTGSRMGMSRGSLDHWMTAILCCWSRASFQPPKGIVAALLKVGKRKGKKLAKHNHETWYILSMTPLFAQKTIRNLQMSAWIAWKHVVLQSFLGSPKAWEAEKQIVLTRNIFTAANLTSHIDHLLGHRHFDVKKPSSRTPAITPPQRDMSTQVFTFDQVSSCFFTCPKFLFPFRCCVFPAWFHECYGRNFRESWRWELLNGILSGSLRCVTGRSWQKKLQPLGHGVDLYQQKHHLYSILIR